MADFTVGETSTADLDNNAVLAFYQSFILENEQAQILDENIVEYKFEIDAASLSFPRFDALSPTATPLIETEDPDSTAMGDTDITVTPLEFGRVITTTKLSNLQSGGRTDVGAAALVGKNAGRSQDLRCMRTLDGASKVILAGTASGSPANPTPTDIVDVEFFERAYNSLARDSVPYSGDYYVAIMHDDTISDIREASGSNSWTDVNKYADGSTAERLLKNEVGMFKGFRIVRQNDATLKVRAGGAGSPALEADVYNSYFVGYNAVAKGVSYEPMITITGPFDKLGRFLNIGWFGVYDYVLVEPQALVLGHSASSREA